MEYTNLGKSGLQISRLSLGSWLTFGKQIGDDVAERLMDIAYENGDFKGAIETAKQSIEAAEKDGDQNYVRMNKASIEEWSKKK